mgnify:CR=1 FL=1
MTFDKIKMADSSNNNEFFRKLEQIQKALADRQFAAMQMQATHTNTDTIVKRIMINMVNAWILEVCGLYACLFTLDAMHYLWLLSLM